MGKGNANATAFGQAFTQNAVKKQQERVDKWTAKNSGENANAFTSAVLKNQQNRLARLNSKPGVNKQVPMSSAVMPPSYTNNPMAPGTVAPVTPGMVDATMPVNQVAPTQPLKTPRPKQF